MYCSHCGKEILKKARFCSDCGKETDRINVNVDIPETINVENRIRTGRIISSEKLLCVKKWIAKKTILLLKIVFVSIGLFLLVRLISVSGIDMSWFDIFLKNYGFISYSFERLGLEYFLGVVAFFSSHILGIYILISMGKWIQFYANKK